MDGCLKYIFEKTMSVYYIMASSKPEYLHDLKIRK